jgi:hypothetical protein
MTLASSRHTYPLAAVVRTAQSAGRDIGAPQGLARYEQTHRRATRLLYLKRAVAAPPSLVHQPAPACGPDALACRIPTAGKTPLPFPKNMAWPALYGRNPTASKHKAYPQIWPAWPSCSCRRDSGKAAPPTWIWTTQVLVNQRENPFVHKKRRALLLLLFINKRFNQEDRETLRAENFSAAGRCMPCFLSRKLLQIKSPAH